jgi:hypothetical protein
MTEALTVNGGTVRISRRQASVDNPDLATAQTVAAMVDLIWDAVRDPLVRHFARMVRYRWAGSGLGCWRSPEDLAAGSWWWVKHSLRFVHDDTLLRRLLNETGQLEALVSPAVSVRGFIREGDCDDFTMLVCSFLSVLGVPWEIVTVAADPTDPERFSHVYARAVLADGGRLPLDASHGHYPGWEVPKGDVMRVRVWDESGRPIPGAGFAGLRGYVRARPVRVWPALVRRRGLGGICASGIDDETGEACDETVLPVAAAAGPSTTVLTSSWWQTPAASSGGAVVATGAAAPSAASGWDKTLQNLLQSWTAIGSKVIAPTTTITTKTGSVSIPGSQAGAVLGTTNLLGTTISSTTLLLIGAAVLGMMMLSKR